MVNLQLREVSLGCPNDFNKDKTEVPGRSVDRNGGFKMAKENVRLIMRVPSLFEMV